METEKKRKMKGICERRKNERKKMKEELKCKMKSSPKGGKRMDKMNYRKKK